VRKTPPWRATRRPARALRPIVVIPIVVALLVGVLSALPDSGPQAADGSAASPGKEPSALDDLPQPVRPAFVPGRPTFLRAGAHATTWAVVRAAAAARAGPNSRARTVGGLETRTPEGTSNIVVVLGNRVDRAGVLWIHVRLPILGEPNTAWVPRNALGGYGTVTTHLVVDLGSLRAILFRRGRAIFGADIGVGKPSWPTPRGEFYVRNKLTGFASPMYGPVAFGTSARSSVLTDWPAGGYVGIHGTDRPDLLPGRVSHGCIRMRNEDILRLSKLMPIGTPITIR
jgi:hypothetical protein